MNKDTTIIQTNDLTKYYGETIGIKGINLSIHKGEIFGFLGQNGAGKTTTLRLLLNILLPSSGSADIFGVNVSRTHPEIKEEIGYLPGELNIPGHYSVSDFLHYIASLRQKSSHRMEEIAHLFDLPMDKRVDQLSKGNKQKVGIVLAFMSDPELYILDEPTSGLDPIYQQILYDLISVEKTRGKTIFFSSHNLDEVQRICDRVAIIRKGKLVGVENVDGIAVTIPRTMTALIENLGDNDVTELLDKGFKVTSSCLQTGLIEIEIGNGGLSQALSALNKLQLIDLAYPPASLEEYFLSKYQEKVVGD
ncbi:MAG: ABC transporter ATP-binding protein [Candidatus Kariarchaeaceae archaeon]|jgi:ABC-2 type transport system ATP-binding protein